jgi:hypothetical protein
MLQQHQQFTASADALTFAGIASTPHALGDSLGHMWCVKAGQTYGASSRDPPLALLSLHPRVSSYWLDARLHLNVQSAAQEMVVTEAGPRWR